MALIQNIRLYFHHRFLDQQRKQLAFKRRRVNFETAQHIGILFNATDLDRRNIVLKYVDELRKQGKKVRLLGFFNDDTAPDADYTFKFYNRRQIDWALRPTGEWAKRFLQEPLDILITLNPVTDVLSEYIAALAPAHLKVGPVTENTYCYDLMIDAADKTDLRKFIQQAELLLSKTNPRHERA